jgi:hypothetical protein
VKGPNPLHHHIHQKEVHMQNVYIKTCVLSRQRESESSSAIRQATSTGPGGVFDSPSGCPPVGGALSGNISSTWQVQAAGAHRPSDRRGRVVPRSKQPRRCQAAEGSRQPARLPGG